MRAALLALAAALALSQSAAAQYRFVAGETLVYDVRQTTTVEEAAPDEGSTEVRTGMTVTKLELEKRWRVVAVDAAGVATLELTISRMKQEIARPGPLDKAGKPTVDRVTLDSATEEGRGAMPFLGKPVQTVRVNAAGELVSPPAGKKPPLPPFALVFPTTSAPSWTRPLPATLEPPYGTGEVVELVQRFEALTPTTVRLTTAPKDDKLDAVNLAGVVSLLSGGELKFENGRYLGGTLKVDRTVERHAGPNSKLRYESTVVETLKPGS